MYVYGSSLPACLPFQLLSKFEQDGGGIYNTKIGTITFKGMVTVDDNRAFDVRGGKTFPSGRLDALICRYLNVGVLHRRWFRRKAS